MITKINNLALRGLTTAQVKGAEVAAKPASREVTTTAAKLQMAAGAAIAYLLYLITVPAIAADKDTQNVVALIDRFTNFIVILVAAISVLMGVFAALQFVGSGGNSQVASRAKSTIKNVVIGLVVCAGVFILKNAVLSVVAAGGSGNENKFNKTLKDNGGKIGG